MKGINISCNSENSTALISFNMELQSSESPSSIFACTSSSTTVGGRAIDRYNPIITDEKRRGAISRSAPTTPCVANYNVRTPVSPLIMRSRKKKAKNVTHKIIKNIDNVPKSSGSNCADDGDEDDSKASDVVMKGGCTIARGGVEYAISPPESSRYLLDDTSFLNVLSDFDPVVKLVPFDSKKDKDDEGVKLDNVGKPPKPPLATSSSSGSSDQVVVLRVSLHCRGCERKLKKHLSRMAGVTSFNIDFTAKKVTVVGDVTPLGVLSNISKVKNAQLWTPTVSSSFPTKQGS